MTAAACTVVAVAILAGILLWRTGTWGKLAGAAVAITAVVTVVRPWLRHAAELWKRLQGAAGQEAARLETDRRVVRAEVDELEGEYERLVAAGQLAGVLEQRVRERANTELTLEQVLKRIDVYGRLAYGGQIVAAMAILAGPALFVTASIVPFFVWDDNRGEAIFYWLAGWAILNTVVSFYYYVRFIKVMYLGDRIADNKPLALSPALVVTLVVCVIGVIAIGIAPQKVLNLTQDLIRPLTTIGALTPQ